MICRESYVLPRLKKPSLDPSNLSSYKPISNLSFFVTSVFKKHRITHHLYADDKQGYMYVDVPISNIATARTTVQDCVSDVSS